MSVKLFIASVLFFTLQVSFARKKEVVQARPGQVFTDEQLIQAVQSRRSVFFVEAGELVVEKILPVDKKGLPHQKWLAKLSDGNSVQIVYNSKKGERIPIKVGDKFQVGGQFLWTARGGILHWLHDDPEGKRPSGYVYLKGVVYGDWNSEE